MNLNYNNMERFFNYLALFFSVFFAVLFMVVLFILITDPGPNTAPCLWFIAPMGIVCWSLVSHHFLKKTKFLG